MNLEAEIKRVHAMPTKPFECHIDQSVRVQFRYPKAELRQGLNKALLAGIHLYRTVLVQVWGKLQQTALSPDLCRFQAGLADYKHPCFRTTKAILHRFSAQDCAHRLVFLVEKLDMSSRLQQWPVCFDEPGQGRCAVVYFVDLCSQSKRYQAIEIRQHGPWRGKASIC